MPNNKSKDENTNFWPLILLSVGVICLFAFSWWWLATTINDPEEQGQFGDQFGAVNALFSGLAFAGLIFTIILQKKELALQREELSQTKEELRGQKEQLAEQNKTLKIQRFENTFFHMMELQQQIVLGLQAQKKEIVPLKEETSSENRGYRTIETVVELKVEGRSLFSWTYNKMDHQFVIAPGKVATYQGLREALSKRGFKEYLNLKSPKLFDHYFRHIYTILTFIDKQDDLLNEDEKYEYAKILRATLSRHELVWLYYNGLSEYGNKKLKPLIEQYCMLNNIREDLLVCSKENQELLSKAGLTIKQTQDEGYSGTDYEFFLTTEWGDESKYHFSAFYKSYEKQIEGRNLISDWNNFLNKE